MGYGAEVAEVEIEELIVEADSEVLDAEECTVLEAEALPVLDPEGSCVLEAEDEDGSVAVIHNN